MFQRHAKVHVGAVAVADVRVATGPPSMARESMRILIDRARENKQFLFLFVNNRLEGNAPLTILSVVEP